MTREETDEIYVDFVTESRFGLDGGAMFGIIPKPLWERTNPADDNNRIELVTRCLLIRHPEEGNILVDTGVGHKWDAKGEKIYKIRHEDDSYQSVLGLEAGLAEHGLTRDDIDHVILTHLHFDHAGGVSRWIGGEEGGEVVPTFPGRPHYVLRENWEWANDPSERDKGSYRRRDFRFFEETPEAAPLTLLEGITEVFDGVTLIPRRGHTYGMACVKVDAADDTYIYMADLIPTSGHIRIPYVMGYDLQPVVTCREKREILSEAARHGWKLVFEHDPHVATCYVEPTGNDQWRRVEE